MKVSGTLIFDIGRNNLKLSACGIKIQTARYLDLHAYRRLYLKHRTVSGKDNAVDYGLIVFDREISMISGRHGILGDLTDNSKLGKIRIVLQGLLYVAIKMAYAIKIEHEFRGS